MNDLQHIMLSSDQLITSNSIIAVAAFTQITVTIQ